MSRIIGFLLLSVLCCTLAIADRSDSDDSSPKRIAPSSSQGVLEESCFQDDQYTTKFYFYPVTKDTAGNIYYQGNGVYNNQNTSIIFGNFDVSSSFYNFVLYYSQSDAAGRTRVYNFARQADDSYTGALTYGVNANQDGYFDPPKATTVSKC